MANALEQEWNNYFVQLNDVERKSILLMLKTFLQRRNEDTDRISVEQYNKEIDEALAAVEAATILHRTKWKKGRLNGKRRRSPSGS